MRHRPRARGGRPAARSPDGVRPGPVPGGGHERVERWPDGEWVVRRVSGTAGAKAYRCPGCDQPLPAAIPHVVAWPVAGGTLSGGGVVERRHWHSACWQARDRRRPR